MDTNEHQFGQEGGTTDSTNHTGGPSPRRPAKRYADLSEESALTATISSLPVERAEDREHRTNSARTKT